MIRLKAIRGDTRKKLGQPFTLGREELRLTSNAPMRQLDSRIQDRLLAQREGFARLHEIVDVRSYRSGVVSGI